MQNLDCKKLSVDASKNAAQSPAASIVGDGAKPLDGVSTSCDIYNDKHYH